MKISFKIKLLFYWYKIFRSNNKIDSLIKISKGGEGVFGPAIVILYFVLSSSSKSSLVFGSR